MQESQVHNAFLQKAVKGKLCWSKNAHEERDSPWQHVFRCVDWCFCCLSNVGLWLELLHSMVPDAQNCHFIFVFSKEALDPKKAAKQTKK